MNVKELKELLNNLDESYDDAKVIISKDSEGNRFSPFSDITEDALYLKEDSWEGEIYCKDSYKDTQEEREEWESFLEDEDYEKAIVLWPLN